MTSTSLRTTVSNNEAKSVHAYIENVSALDAARIMTEERLVHFPKYPQYIHALEQIRFIANVLSQKRCPSQQEREFVDIGLMAVKEFDASDPDYANVLSELSFQFKKL